MGYMTHMAGEIETIHDGHGERVLNPLVAEIELFEYVDDKFYTPKRTMGWYGRFDAWMHISYIPKLYKED